MKLIVGLGNPGKKFQNTRHNLGFMIIDDLVKELTPMTGKTVWDQIAKPKIQFCKLKEIIIMKPQTYMNLSGLAVSYLKNFYKIETRDIWIIHDDIDLPLGKLRIRRGGASAGHNGIESIMKELGETDFVRFRIGIGKHRKADQGERNLHRREVEKYVLSPFGRTEAGTLRKMIKKTNEAIKICLKDGLEKGMNRFN
ncbi:MAG: aminoacyl-tRNA hydrolase [Patescibacteria group bacterium]|nr:aminoacyl-tRNA hydrolase [Patescibacteria group bacterium]